MEGGKNRTTTEGRCDAAWNVAATKSARLDRVRSATAPGRAREASSAAPRAPPRVPDASTPAGRMVAIADSTASPAAVERHATGSARRPFEGTSICEEPSANPRPPNRAHPSLLRPCVARRINVTFAGPLRGGRQRRRPSIEAHARSFYTQDDDSRRSSRTRARSSGSSDSIPSRRVRLAERAPQPVPPPADDGPVVGPHAVVAVGCASAGAGSHPPPHRPPSSSRRYPPRRRTRRG